MCRFYGFEKAYELFAFENSFKIIKKQNIVNETFLVT